jgi:anti-sigma factor RsiW
VSAHVLELLSAYFDDELVPADRAAIDLHLRDCAGCARRLEEIAAVDALARALPAEAPEAYFDDFSARVRAGVAAWARGARRLAGG